MPRRARSRGPDVELPPKRLKSDDSSSASEDEPDSNKENGDSDEDISLLKAGRIIKMHLKNFMCHANLMIEFNPHINLLVGNNGSGKSAILTALAIGLGAKAASTNRGTSIKNLIKHGETSCSIEIHLSNTGYDAYLPQEYGEKIIISRHVTASGSSQYKLKNEKGKVISTSRQELEKMMICMNIQVENPVVMLNQDCSRSFLKDCDTKRLFKLFMEATQLELIIQKLNECHSYYLTGEHHLNMKNMQLKVLKMDLQRKVQRYEELKSLNSLRETLANYKLQNAWLNVTDFEKEKKEKELALYRVSKQIDEVITIIRNKDNLDAEVQNRLKGFNEQIEAKRQLLATELQQAEKMREKINQKETEVRNHLQNVQRIEAQKKRLTSDVQQIESTLQETFNTESLQTLRQKNAKLLAGYLAEQEDLEHLKENSQRDVDMFRQTLSKYEEQQETVQQKRLNVSSRIRRFEDEIQQLTSSSSDALSVYGPQMSQFIRRLTQEYQKGKFSEMPRGPFGRYIEVPDKKWRTAVENICFNMLTAFAVNSDTDRVHFQNLLKSEFPQLPRFAIITSKFTSQVYNVSAGKTDGGNVAHVLMDLITVKDPVVMNTLIDQLRIETILICEDQNTAIELTQEEQYVPANLFKVFSMNPFSEFYPAPSYRSYSVTVKPCRYIQVNTDELKRQMQENLRIEKEKLQRIEAELQSVKQQHAEMKRKYNERDKQLSNFEMKIRSVKTKITEIKNYEYPVETDAEMLQTELVEIKEKLAQLEPYHQEEKEAIASLQLKVQAEEKKLEEYHEKKKKIEQDILAVQRTHDREHQRLYEIATNTNAARAQKDMLTNQAKEAQAEYEAVEKKLSLARTEAETCGERVANTLTREDLNRKIAQIEQQVKQLDSKTDTLEDLERAIQIKTAEVSKNQNLVQTLSKTLELLYDSRMKRFNYLKNLKSFLAIQVQYKFRQVLKVRNFHGNILFDYKAKTLELRVIPRGKDGVANTKSLSGGERSYSTVAFLIALWSCIDHPFYFLDEYDVFTDQVNRFIMTKLLIFEAEKKGDQFAFLTPQDMSSVTSSENLTIHRFADPERRAPQAH